MWSVEGLRQKYYSGDSYDGTLQFYEWIRQYATPTFIVLNVGAGPSADRKVKSLKGEVRLVVGVDIDNAVLRNDDLDEACLVHDHRIPFEDSHFDLAWADFVFEHVENPIWFFREVYRVLKPGASFFFRTPNQYHYVSLIAKCTPHWFHELVANRARGLPEHNGKPHRTFYRLNTRRDILRSARDAGFRCVETSFVEKEPSYLMFHPVAFLMGMGYERVVNRFDVLATFRANIFGRLVK